MEAQTAQPPSGSGPSSAAYPRWVMLEQYSSIEVRKSSRSDDGDSSCSADDDAKTTLAAAHTSLGHRIQFSLHLAEADPLALAASRLRIIQAPDATVAEEVEYTYRVVAAHGDSLLIHVEQDSDLYSATDYFVYNAGDAAAQPPRPPSLSLLPPCHVFYPPTGEGEEEEPVPRHLDANATGLLRRGDDELVVAELTRTAKVEDMKLVKVTELCLFRSSEWSVISPPVSYGDGDTGGVWEELPAVWHTVVPVGDQRLCWMHLSHGILAICEDVFTESPRLRYLRHPVDPCLGQPSRWNSNVCESAGGDALKFVSIFPRCCCGGAGNSNCECSRHAYTIHAWTIMIDSGSMEWVKDGVVDATELWALDAYMGLPRVPLDQPVMSMDECEPHIVYFQLCESKTIQSVSRREDWFSYNVLTLIPSNVLHFVNSCRSNAGGDGALTGQRVQMGIEGQPAVVVVDDEQLVREDDASNLTLRPSSLFVEPSKQASEFLEAFLEIPKYGLGGDELKAYRILSHDNGRQFRTLLRLPKNLRKEWLLMEIKASQAY